MKEIVSTISSKGQVTIPVEIRRQLGVGDRDKVAFRIDAAGTVVLVPAADALEAVFGSVKRPASMTANGDDFSRQIQEASEEHAARVFRQLQDL